MTWLFAAYMWKQCQLSASSTADCLNLALEILVHIKYQFFLLLLEKYDSDSVGIVFSWKY